MPARANAAGQLDLWMGAPPVPTGGQCHITPAYRGAMSHHPRKGLGNVTLLGGPRYWR